MARAADGDCGGDGGRDARRRRPSRQNRTQRAGAARRPSGAAHVQGRPARHGLLVALQQTAGAAQLVVRPPVHHAGPLEPRRVRHPGPFPYHHLLTSFFMFKTLGFVCSILTIYSILNVLHVQ